jgi:hypothetical protein
MLLMSKLKLSYNLYQLRWHGKQAPVKVIVAQVPVRWMRRSQEHQTIFARIRQTKRDKIEGLLCHFCDYLL